MERLDKLLATKANMSRKDAKLLIKQGEVKVNGAPAKSAEQKISDDDMVEVRGNVISHAKFVYYMMNKPSGVISATEDKKQQTVLDLLPQNLMRKGLFPAGRLDKDTEGFMLITDDGALAHRILSPKHHVPKRYFVRLDGAIPPELAQSFERGVDIGGGEVTSSAEITVLKNDGESEAEVVIYEGMYHQIKRMFERFDLNVIYLKRLSIGGLLLDDSLELGDVRIIAPDELLLISTELV